MMYVEVTYSPSKRKPWNAKKLRGGRRIVSTSLCWVKGSSSTWNVQEYGNHWFRMMAWNKAAFITESGFPKKWASKMYEKGLVGRTRLHWTRREDRE